MFFRNLMIVRAACRHSVLGFAATLWLFPIVVAAQAPTDVNNPGIYPKPPTPLLPPAGGVITDPTFGTQVLRVTDPTVAPVPMNVNSKPQSSMFNADGTLFYLFQNGGPEGWLFGLNRVAFTVTKIATLPKSTSDGKLIGYDGAMWHPTTPTLFYAMSDRRLYELDVSDPAHITSTLLHDFTPELPPGGFAAGGANVDQLSGRYFAHTASTFGGKDQFDYVAVWDRQTNTAVATNILARIPGATGLHTVTIDHSGRYVELAVVGSGLWFWNWQTDTLTEVSGCAQGHRATGDGVSLNPCTGGDFVIRSMATPDQWTTAFVTPKKPGQSGVTHQDNHSSRVLADGRTFFVSQYVPATQRTQADADWLPLMEEIFEVQLAFGGLATWRRFAHTRAVQTNNNVFFETPRANVDPTGSFVLWASNWDGTLPRPDVFLLKVATAASACNVTSVGFTPINDLGVGLYKGFQGGLYPGGSNLRPSAHDATGIMLGESIQPLDSNGNPDPTNGKYVLFSIGMSNTSAEFGEFKRLADADPSKDPHLVVVNGATGGCAAGSMSRPELTAYPVCWQSHLDRLTAAGVTQSQVVAIWLKQAFAGPTEPFPTDAQKLQDALDKIIFIEAKSRFPNLKLVYVSSRIYAGYATTNQNPEPFAYQSGFAVKWLVEAHLASSALPWVAWGPYLWADGLSPRSDGLTWACSDLADDGTHPSPSGGQKKVADLLMSFFRTDATAREFYLAESARPPSGGDFALSFDPATVNASPGDAVRVRLDINHLGGFNGNVTVTPPDASAQKIVVKPSDSVSTTDTSVSFKLKVKRGARPGTHPLTFTGKDDSGRARTATVTVVIQ